MSIIEYADRREPDPLPGTPGRLFADSDVGTLERVLVHRPGAELRTVSAATARALLFDGPVDARRAGREHDELVEALRSHGARVDRLDGAREPLPNLMFTRDLFAVIGDGVLRGRLRRAARVREGAIAERALAQLGAGAWWSRGELQVEGGDVMLAGAGVVVVGIGERTRAAAARELARRLLHARAAREVIGAVLPPGGPFHLDLALTLVSHDMVVGDLPVLDRTRCVSWRSGATPRLSAGLLPALRRARGGALGVVAAAAGTHGRVWDSGANVVALAPGRVVAYADNEPTNRRLERAGIEVLRVPGTELGKGRGGPRCLTAPLRRVPTAPEVRLGGPSHVREFASNRLEANAIGEVKW